jgi:hypothetical protein
MSQMVTYTKLPHFLPLYISLAVTVLNITTVSNYVHSYYFDTTVQSLEDTAVESIVIFSCFISIQALEYLPVGTKHINEMWIVHP